MRQVVYLLFGASFTVSVSWSLGKLLLRRLRLKLYRQEENLLAFIAGSALLSLLVFVLCTLGFARKGVFFWVGVASFAVLFRTRSHVARGGSFPPLPRSWTILFGSIFAVYAALYVCNAMAPEVSPDGTTYHLGLVARYLRWHGFHPITTNMYSNLSQGLEMLFLFAFAFGRHSAAALVHCAFLLALPFLVLSYSRRFGFVSAGICAALLTFVSPMFGIDGSSAYNDVALGCVVFALFYAGQIWLSEGSASLLVLIGLLAGFAYAIKYTGFVGVLYAFGLVVWKSARERKVPFGALATVSLAASIMIVPWMAKNWIWLGNPVSPFLNTIFPNPAVHISFEKSYSAYFRTYGLTNFWQVPYLVTVTGALGGLLGPVFLLAPFGLLAIRRPAGRQLWIAALAFGIPYAGNIGTRFLIPVVPFIALAMALAFQFSFPLATAMIVVHALLSWPTAVRLYQVKGGCWNINEMPVRAALRLVPEETFLMSHSPIYWIGRRLERFVPPGARVLSTDAVADAYITRDVMVAYESAEGNLQEDILLTPLFPDYQPTWRLEFSFPATQVRTVRVVQAATSGNDIWSVSELRLLRGGIELPREPRWRVRAHPFPWNATLAFDNSPVTRWRSWQGLFPGMFLEADLGGIATIDTVTIEASHDQYRIDLHLECRDASGVWRRLGSRAAQSDIKPVPRLRRAAALEIKARGTDYLLVENSSAMANDFRANQQLWGFALVDEWGGGRLYRID